MRLSKEEAARLLRDHPEVAEALALKPIKKKYNNQNRIVDGVAFHSIKEAKRYSELLLMLKAGVIRDLQLQYPFRCDLNGVHICVYKCDFRYFDADGKEVIEDVKGYRTPVYKIKRNLMKALGVNIVEI